MGCFFHYRQCLYCNLQKFKDLNELYTKDSEQKARMAFNCFAALSLVRKEEVNFFYKELLKHPYLVAHKEEYAPFIAYF